MSERIPPTSTVRVCYVRPDLIIEPGPNSHRGPEFDRWYAAELRKAKVEALREARDNVRASSFWADGSDNYADRVRGWLSNRADQMEEDQ